MGNKFQLPPLPESVLGLSDVKIANIEIDLSDQASGLYLITVQGNGINKSFKVIKE